MVNEETCIHANRLKMMMMMMMDHAYYLIINAFSKSQYVYTSILDHRQLNMFNKILRMMTIDRSHYLCYIFAELHVTETIGAIHS